MRLSRQIAFALFVISLTALPMVASNTGGFQRTLQVSGPIDIDLSSGSGNVNVHTGGSGAVVIVARIRSQYSWFAGDVDERIRRIEQNPPIEQVGSRIRVGRFEDRDLQRNLSIDYDLTVPPQTRLTTRTGSGDQSISGVQLSLSTSSGSGNVAIESVGGDVRISTGSGDVRASSIKGALAAEAGSGNIRATGVGGSVTARAGSGDIDVQQVSGGDARVDTGSGNVTLRGIKGGVRVQTGSGDIRLEGEPANDWHVSAGSGSIDLRLPSQASFNLDARTSSGNLTVHRSVTMQGTVSRNHVTGKVGSGGVLVDLHTGSGNIELN
ncbi:MAG TPA: DUF4097 family beta strand repeat-containing protein [Alphaproteobacteria bacterium]|nr:DUF4097 family beta strand repeat-containing protein [Alphaproteobacteria bacterium]